MSGQFSEISSTPLLKMFVSVIESSYTCCMACLTFFEDPYDFLIFNFCLSLWRQEVKDNAQVGFVSALQMIKQKRHIKCVGSTETKCDP